MSEEKKDKMDSVVDDDGDYDKKTKKINNSKSPLLSRHSSSKSFKIKKERRSLIRTKTSINMKNDASTEENLHNIPISIKEKFKNNKKQEDLYISLLGVGFEEEIALQAALHCKTFAEAISYKNKRQGRNKLKPSLSHKSFRGKRNNISKSVQNVLKSNGSFSFRHSTTGSRISKPKLGRLKLSTDFLQSEEDIVIFDSIDEEGKNENDKKKSDITKKRFIGIEEGMELRSEYVNEVYEIKDKNSENQSSSGVRHLSQMNIIEIKFVDDVFPVAGKPKENNDNKKFAIFHSIKLPTRRATLFEEITWKPTHSNHNGIDFVGYYEIKIFDKKDEFYHGHLYIPGYLTCDPASKIISMSRKCERAFRSFIMISLKALKMRVTLAHIKELWLEKFIPYLSDKYQCFVMAHWVLHQIIFIFDETCDLAPSTYALFIKKSIEYVKSSNNLNEKENTGLLYTGADHLYSVCCDYLNQFISYVAEHDNRENIDQSLFYRRKSSVESMIEKEFNNNAKKLQRQTSKGIIQEDYGNYQVVK